MHVSFRHLSTRLSLCFILGLLFPLVGCQTAEVAPAAPQDWSANEMRITLLPPLNRSIAIGQVATSYGNDGLMRITVDVTPNPGTLTKSAEYLIEWFDGNGMKIDTPLSRYTRIDLRPQQAITLRGIAPTTTTADFRITLRSIK